MGDFLDSLPGPAWVLIGVLATALVTWTLGLLKNKQDAGTLALNLANSLRDDVSRLDARVETLERERNAYRSWAHVLWGHIFDENTPRIPPPNWPVDLAR